MDGFNMITDDIDRTIFSEYDLVYENEAVIFFTPEDKHNYINSTTGRTELLNDCTQYNRMDLYEEVLKVWGNNPTVEDPKEITLDDLKADKQNELNDAFNRAVEGSFTTTEGYKMQFNTDDSLKMFGAIQLLESSGVESGYITDADDITHYDIPLATMKSVQNQMLNKYAQCHLLKQQYRALIEATSDEEALADIEFQFD